MEQWRENNLTRLVDELRDKNNSIEKDYLELKTSFNKVLTDRMVFHYILDKVEEYKNEMKASGNYDISDKLRDIIPEMYSGRTWTSATDQWWEGYKEWYRKFKNENK